MPNVCCVGYEYDGVWTPKCRPIGYALTTDSLSV